MRVSDRISKLWASALTIALAVVTTQAMTFGQIVSTATQSTDNSVTSSSAPASVTADQWLKQAKAAMAKGDKRLAEFSIEVAEELLKKQPATSLTYTPAMARQELAQLSGREQTGSAMQAEFGSRVPAPANAAGDKVAEAKASLLKARRAIANQDVATASAILTTLNINQRHFPENRSRRLVETLLHLELQ